MVDVKAKSPKKPSKLWKAIADVDGEAYFYHARAVSAKQARARIHFRACQEHGRSLSDDRLTVSFPDEVHPRPKPIPVTLDVQRDFGFFV